MQLIRNILVSNDNVRNYLFRGLPELMKKSEKLKLNKN